MAASIDTPLHAFLPFRHVDHLHPDWAIALAASANGKAKLEQFNQKSGRQNRLGPVAAAGIRARPDAAQAVRGIPTATESSSAATACSPGAHAPECYLSSIKTIDQMGEFVQGARKEQRQPSSAAPHSIRGHPRSLAGALLPYLRGASPRTAA